MKKVFLIISFVFCGKLVFAQFPISPIKISFEKDFKGKPDESSPFVALTVLTWQYSYKTKLYKNQLQINFKQEEKVEKTLSWVKLDRLENEDLKEHVLHHEQGHVNINFIMVKEADRAMSSRTYSKRNYRAEIGTLASSISQFFDTMQKNYDSETEHGSNYKMQARWDKIIQDRMNEVTLSKD